MGAALLTAYTVGRTKLPAVTGYEIAFARERGRCICRRRRRRLRDPAAETAPFSYRPRTGALLSLRA
jgi:hypothetical protein